VYDHVKREIVYASGGHPPAILQTGKTTKLGPPQELKSRGLVIGAMSGAEFTGESAKVGKMGKLYIFSDGVYEIGKSDGTMLQLDEFISELGSSLEMGEADLERMVNFSQNLNGPGPFADDFSIVQICFN